MNININGLNELYDQRNNSADIDVRIWPCLFLL